MPRPIATRAHGRSRGQSLVEFALLAPLFLLIMGGALDMGRLFYAHVAIENAAKEGALYGASNPRCNAPKEGCADPNTVRWHVLQEAVGIPDLTHSVTCLEDDGDVESVNECRPGDRYRVHVESEFRFVTPILVPVMGDRLELRSTAIADVRVGAFDPDATPIPIPTPTPSPTPAPTAGPTATPGGGATPAPTVSGCTVPNLLGVKVNSAGSHWQSAGFIGALTEAAGAPNGNFTIGWQSLSPGSVEPCTSGMEVDE